MLRGFLRIFAMVEPEFVQFLQGPETFTHLGPISPVPEPLAIHISQSALAFRFSDLNLPALDLPASTILEALPASARNELLAKAVVERFRPGHEIPSRRGSICIIQDGEGKCFLNNAAGQKFFLSELKPGAILGELSALLPNKPNDKNITIEADTTVLILRVPKDLFMHHVLRSPAACEMLLKILAERLDSMNRVTESMIDPGADPSTLVARTRAERAADWLTSKLGSWSFIGYSLAMTTTYIAANVGLFAVGMWDPYPFVFLNLLFSLSSAYSAPIVVMSQNRRSALDRQVDRANQLTQRQMLKAILDKLHRMQPEDPDNSSS
jgi:uncharacterized membrane protein